MINISEKYNITEASIDDYKVLSPSGDFIEKDGAIYERIWDADNSAYDEICIAVE